MLTMLARAAAYRIAREVYEDRLTAAKGARDLSSEHNVPNGSAKILIEVYKCLRAGRLFKRALSAPDMDYFLSFILADDGQLALQTAVQSLWEHIDYFERRSGKVDKLRGVATKHQSFAGTPQFERDTTEEFEKAVEVSLQDDTEKRRERLRNNPNRIPARVALVTWGFARNPDVVAEVRYLANGKCQECKRPAPFRRRTDGKPYLEVHHKRRLADHGEDTVANAIALCPNCHRKRHYGPA
jgi:5-methylcytosine-specific restriction enzyme A